MRAQIRGLDQASINTQDGVGLIQTAEGAMATVSDMVIRVRELMVQAANDTNTFNNREMIQLEIDQIMTEINDVTFRTQFNTRTLLAGGLGGEGGGPSSPVSLQWMVFEQARVFGLPQPGGIVTSTPDGVVGRMPNVHYNTNNRTQTSLRSDIIGLQNDLNALARRVAERKVADPSLAFDGDDLSAMFEDVRNLNFDNLDLLPAERTQLQSISSRIESMLRTGLRAAEEMFQITQDQVNALGGAGAINADGSTVFSGSAVANWQEARNTLQSVRDNFEMALNDLNSAMTSTDPLEAMNQAVQSLVGVIGGAGIYSALDAAAGAAGAATAEEFASFFFNNGTVLATVAPPTTADDIASINGRSVVPGVFLFHDGTNWSLNTRANGQGDTVNFGTLPATAPSDFSTTVTGNATWLSAGTPTPASATDFATALNGGTATTAAEAEALNGISVAPGVRLVHTGYTAGTPPVQNFVFHDAFGQVVPPPAVANTFVIPPPPGNHFWVPGVAAAGGDPAIPPRHIAHGAPLAPVNTILADMEELLDLATDVLGNVNLESSAMWFQIGANTMQGMVLQLEGIHTGVLGGGRGDLAMLIDVREHSGIPISEQLEIIDIAEGIVNAQRAQLGAVQNRLEFTRQSLDNSSENLSAAESRVRDTDMAREMMRFTQAQVLQQAGISMLAQANQLPASILQLLQ
jgi:flagellin